MKTLLLFTFLLFLAGCGTQKVARVTKEMILPREVDGPFIPGNQSDSIRSRGHEKAYTVGRYIDPCDNSVQHEAGLVYRIEESPTWNLAPNEPFHIPFREQATNRQRLLESQMPLVSELETEVAGQKELRGKLIENNSLVRKTLTSSMTMNQTTLKALKKIESETKRMSELEARLIQLEKQRAQDQETIKNLRDKLNDRTSSGWSISPFSADKDEIRPVEVKSSPRE